MTSRIKKSILKLKESSTLVINEKSKKLISQGKKVYQFGFGQSPFPVPEKIVEGCSSQVWLHCYMQSQKVFFTADSDAIMTKGIIALLIRVLSHHSPQEIAESKLNFIAEIGITDQLSPTRANGLVSMIKQMKIYAVALNN